jgi:hypothetical protein
MKKNTKKIAAVSGIAILLISGLATGVGYLNANNESDSTKKVSSSGELSAEKQTAIVEKIVSMSDSGYRPTEIEKELRKNIEQLEKENSTRLVREFMSSIQSTSSYFSQLLYVMGSELEYVKLVDEIKDPLKDKNKISSKLVTGFIDEIERQYLNFKPMDGYYYIEPDASYVLKKYGEYIHGDYKDYLNLSAKQQTEPIFDQEKGMYVIDRVEEDLAYINNSRDRWSDGEYAEDFKDMEVMLYETLFSVNHATFFDLTIENKDKENEEYIYTLKDEIRKKYETIILETSDKTLAKELEEFLNVLKENDYQLNDKVEAFLEEMFTEKFESSIKPETNTEEGEPVSEDETKE